MILTKNIFIMKSNYFFAPVVSFSILSGRMFTVCSSQPGDSETEMRGVGVGRIGETITVLSAA